MVVSPKRAPINESTKEAALSDQPLSVFGYTTVAHAINLHKFLTLFVILGLMHYHNNFTQPAVLYLWLHGLYGIGWLTKHMVFRDKNFDQEIKLGFFIFLFFYVDLYWLAPYFLTKYRFDDHLSTLELSTTMILWSAGMFLHFVSDCQKHFTLKYRGRGLIKDGLFAYTRNPNYLGETLLYMAYCILAQSKVAWGVLIFFFAFTFIPNMHKKDKSLSKYPDFAEYQRSSWLFLPLVW